MTFVKTAVFAAAMAIGLPLGGTASAETVELRLASYLPTTHFGTKLIINPMLQRIEDATNGTVKVTNFPGGQLAKAAGTLSAVKTGVANMGFVGLGYIGDVMPMSTIVEQPGAFTDLEKGYGAYTKLIDSKLLEAEFLPNGVRPIMISILPQVQLVLAKDIEINTMADLAGLKIRVPSPIIGQSIEAMGMVPVEMPNADLYLALERGTVDGSVSLLASLPSYKLNEVTTAATNNLALGSFAFATVINERDWQKLSAEQQAQVLQAGAESGAASVQTLIKVNAGAEKKLGAAGMNIFSVNEEVAAEITAVLQPVSAGWVDGVAKRNPMATEVAEEFRSLLAAE